MRKLAKIALIAVGLIVALVGGAIAWLASLDLNAYKDDIAKEVTAATGRSFSIDGDLKFRLSLIPAIGATSVRLGNAGWSKQKTMVSVGNVVAEVELLPLISGNVRLRRLVLDDVDILLEKNAKGAANWDFGVASSPPSGGERGSESAVLEFRIIHASNLDLTYRDDKTGEAYNAKIEDLDATSEGLEGELQIRTKGRFNTQGYDLSATFGSFPFLSSQSRSAVKISGKLLRTVVAVDGEMVRRGDDYDLAAKADVQGRSVAATAGALQKLLPGTTLPPIPKLGPFRVSANVQLNEEILSLRALDLSVGRLPDARLTAKGGVADVAALSGLDLEVSTEGDEFGKLIEWASPILKSRSDVAVPPIVEAFQQRREPAGPFRVSGRVKGSLNALAVSRVKAAIGKAESIQVEAKGAVKDVIAGSGVDATVKLSGRDLANAAWLGRPFLPEIEGQTIPPLGPFEVAGRFAGSFKRASAADIEAIVGRPDAVRLKVTGAIGDIQAAKGVDLRVGLDGTEFSSAFSLLRLFVPTLKSLDIPPTGAFSFAGRASGSLKNLSLSDLNVSVGHADLLRVTVRGRIQDVLAARGLLLPLTIEARDAGPHARALGFAVPKLPPFKIAATVADRRGGYTFTNLKVAVANSDATGRATVLFDREPPYIDADLKSKRIDVPALVAALAPEGATKHTPEPARQEQEYVFPDDPLPLDALSGLAGVTSINAANLVVDQGYTLENFQGRLEIKNGSQTFAPISFGVAGGQVKAAIRISPPRPTPKVYVEADAKDVDLGRLFKSSGQTAPIVGGKSQLKAQLSGTGISPRRLMASLNGELLVDVGDSTVDTDAVDRISGDFLEGIFDTINPFGETEKKGQVRCVVIHAFSKDGLVQIPSGLGIETRRTAVIGSGTVDLKTEKLDVAIRTEPQKGLKLSVGQQLSQLVRIRGRLHDPTIGVDELGVAKSTLKIGAAVATAGITLLSQRLIQAVRRPDQPCKAARETSPEKDSQSVLQEPTQVVDEPAGVVVRGVEKGVKGIFGGIESIFDGSEAEKETTPTPQ